MDENIRFEFKPQYDFELECKSVELEIINPTSEIDARLDEIEGKIADLDISIDKLTNHADKLDYSIAIASGLISSLIDIVWGGEFSIDEANKWGNEKTENFVVKIAQSQGYKGNDPAGAIRHLENEFPIVADKATNAFGGGLQHHLRDFSHHPTPIGLFFSLLTQFTGRVYGTDVAGVFKAVPVDAEDLIGKNFPEKITFGVIKWFFHMVSDMAGSSSSVGNRKLGTGLPGPLVSFLKEISALPMFRNMNEKGYKEFSVWISKLFNGTLLGERDENGKLIEAVKFDLRTEIGIVHEVEKQAVPVIINECIVRGFYFARRLFTEIKENDVKCVSDLKNINWNNTLPFNNRSVARMITISTGVFEAVDLLDAVIEGAINSKANMAEFGRQVVLRLNFVGIGRFTIALGTDAFMGLRKGKKSRERMLLKAQSLYLLETKMYYGDKLMWSAVKDANQSIDSLFEAMKDLSVEIAGDMKAVDASIHEIETVDVSAVEENNKGLVTELLDIL